MSLVLRDSLRRIGPTFRIVIIAIGYAALSIGLPGWLLFVGFSAEDGFSWSATVSPDKTQTVIGVDYASGGAISPSFRSEIRVAPGIVSKNDPSLNSKGRLLLSSWEGQRAHWAGPGRIYLTGSFE